MTTGPVKRTCGRCARHGYPAAHFPDGYLCGTCLQAALDIRGACPGCGTIRSLPGRRPNGQTPICRDCAGITRHFTCLRCDYEGNLARSRLCHPCAVTQAITETFGDTRHLSPALRSLTDALATAPNPAATARWLARPHIRGLLADIITGRLPLTHQALAARPDWHSAIYLRDLLASCGALPATDRQLADYEGWVHRPLASLAGHPHERLLRQFSLWHQLPRMRAKAATAPLRPSAGKYAEQRFIQAENFLTWAHALGRRPAHLTQADMDTWHATAAIHQKQGARSFLNWAMAARHIPALQLPQLRFAKGEAITQHRRLALLRHYVTDDHAPARIRAIACLMLLYAQPLSRVLRLTVSDITQGDDGQVHIRFGHPPAPVPEPFAGLLLQLITERPATSSNWLFPGRNPGQPAAYATIFTQLRGLGFPMRTARISALRQLVLQAPPPSSPKPSASTTRPPNASTPTQAQPGTATPQATTQSNNPGPATPEYAPLEYASPPVPLLMNVPLHSLDNLSGFGIIQSAVYLIGSKRDERAGIIARLGAQRRSRQPHTTLTRLYGGALMRRRR